MVSINIAGYSYLTPAAKMLKSIVTGVRLSAHRISAQPLYPVRYRRGYLTE